MRHIYGVPYYSKSRREEPWHTRDQDSLGQVVAAIQDQNPGQFSFQWNIFNRGDAYPSDHAMNLSAWKPTDLAITTTRLPLSDSETDPLVVERRGTMIEKRMFSAARDVWQVLKRSQSLLKPEVRTGIGLISGRWGDLRFLANGYGELRRYGAINSKTARDFPLKGCSIGYIFYVPQLSDDAQCAFLSVFSHAAYESLTWSHIIRRKLALQLSDVVHSTSPRLIVACFRTPEPCADSVGKIGESPFAVVVDAVKNEHGWRAFGPTTRVVPGAFEL